MTTREEVLKLIEQMTDDDLISFRAEIISILRNHASEQARPPEADQGG